LTEEQARLEQERKRQIRLARVKALRYDKEEPNLKTLGPRKSLNRQLL